MPCTVNTQLNQWFHRYWDKFNSNWTEVIYFQVNPTRNALQIILSYIFLCTYSAWYKVIPEVSTASMNPEFGKNRLSYPYMVFPTKLSQGFIPESMAHSRTQKHIWHWKSKTFLYKIVNLNKGRWIFLWIQFISQWVPVI